MPVKHEMPSVSPPEFTTLTHNNPLVERFLRWPMVVLLMIGGKCSLFASKPAHISGHLPALTQYVAHFHHERNHQGKDNVLLFPTVNQDLDREGPMQCRERLGGLLK